MNGAGPADHVRLTTTPVVLSDNTAISTLVVDDGEFGMLDIDLGTRTLDIVGGGLLASRSGFRIINGSLTSRGPARDHELVVHVQHIDSEIRANLVDAENSTVSLIKSGPGTLLLSGVNSYRGKTVINQGNVVISQSTALPAGTDVIIGYGNLVNAADQALRVGHLQIDGGSAHWLNADFITMTSGEISQLEGLGTLKKVGVERASLRDSRQFHGQLEILDGMLVARARPNGNR